MLCPQIGTLGILASLAMLNIGPFRVTGHNRTFLKTKINVNESTGFVPKVQSKGTREPEKIEDAQVYHCVCKIAFFFANRTPCLSIRNLILWPLVPVP